MMTQTANEILAKHRKKAKLSLYKAAKCLDVTPQRILQYENGDNIPNYRIRYWAIDPSLPEWVREMAQEIMKNARPN